MFEKTGEQIAEEVLPWPLARTEGLAPDDVLWARKLIAQGVDLSRAIPDLNMRLTVTVDVARAVLWHFGDRNLGIEPGHFRARLFVLASAADDDNLVRLETMFPEEVYAWRVCARASWGMEWLRDLVKRHELHHAAAFGMPLWPADEAASS